jgi:hypothetical protein
MAAAQDTVEVRVGTVATGEIKSLRQGKLIFDLDDMGEVSIEIGDILFLESPTEFEFQTLDGARYFGSIGRGTEPGTVMIAGVSRPLSEIAHLRPIEEEFWSKTGGYLDIGFNAAKANENVSLNIGTQLAYNGRKWTTDFQGRAYYQNRSDAEEIRRGSLRLQAGRLVRDRASVAGAGAWETNSELDLDSRLQIGVGAGIAAWRTTWTELITVAWFLANNEQFSQQAEGTNSVELGLNASLDAFRYSAPKLTHRTSLTVLPSLTQSGRYRFDFETRTSYEIFGDFFVALTFEDNFDSKPPSETAHKNDWTLAFSVGWSW